MVDGEEKEAACSRYTIGFAEAERLSSAAAEGGPLERRVRPRGRWTSPRVTNDWLWPETFEPRRSPEPKSQATTEVEFVLHLLRETPASFSGNANSAATRPHTRSERVAVRRLPVDRWPAANVAIRARLGLALARTRPLRALPASGQAASAFRLSTSGIGLRRKGKGFIFALHDWLCRGRTFELRRHRQRGALGGKRKMGRSPSA